MCGCKRKSLREPFFYTYSFPLPIFLFSLCVFFSFFILPHVHRSNKYILLTTYGRRTTKKKPGRWNKIEKVFNAGKLSLISIAFFAELLDLDTGINVEEGRVFLLNLRVGTLCAKWAVLYQSVSGMCFDFAIDKLWYNSHRVHSMAETNYVGDYFN